MWLSSAVRLVEIQEVGRCCHSIIIIYFYTIFHPSLLQPDQCSAEGAAIISPLTSLLKRGFPTVGPP